MATSTRTHSILSFPPASIEELSSALEHADNQSTFFNRDLCVLSGKTDTPQEVILAKIMHIFHSSVTNASIADLKKFESVFSLYCDSVNKGDSPRHRILTSSAKEVVSTEISLKCEGKESKDSTLLLVTGADNSWCGAMSFRIGEAILSNAPVMLSYGKLIEILQGSFKTTGDSCRETKTYCKNLPEILLKLSDPTKYTIYKHKKSPLIVLLPKDSDSFLNLRNYELSDYKSMQQDTFLIDQGFHNQDFHHPDEQLLPYIIETLSTEESKHIIWAGHGLLDKEALGLPLESVSHILNHAKNVSCWNLRSCYLLGNIRKILSGVELPHSPILVSNGTVDISYPLNDDESLRTYSKLCSSASHETNDPVTSLMKASPWTNGFNIPNHPHVVIKGTILPATLPGVSATITEQDLESHHLSYDNIERLYASVSHVKPALHLLKDISILSGLAETNAHHLFDEIHTLSSLEDFIRYAFLKRSFIKPGISPDKSTKKPQIDGFTHHGQLVFMIKNLHCKDKHYKGVIHLSGGKTFFCEDTQWYDLKDHSPVDIKSILIEALHKSRPSFIKENSDSSFYQDILSTFGLPPDCLHFNDDKQEELKEPPSKRQALASAHRPTAEKSIKHQFKEAIFNQDIHTISLLYPQMDPYYIKSGLTLCMEANLPESFKYMLTQRKDTLTEESIYENLNSIPTLILKCIKNPRPEFIKVVLSLGFNLPEDSLRWTALYGDLATYELVKRATAYEINYEELLNTAIEHENWAVARALTSDMQKLSS